MKLYYKTIIGAGPFGDKPSDWEVLGTPSYCCEAMQFAIKEEAVEYETFPDVGSSGFGLSISKCHPWPEGASWDTYRIIFCPFCGQKIETEEKVRVRLKGIAVTKKVTNTIYTEEIVALPSGDEGATP